MEYLKGIDKIRFPDRIEIVTRYVYYGYLLVLRAFSGKYIISITKEDNESENETLHGNYTDYDYEKLIDIAKEFINQVDFLIIKQNRKLFYGKK